MAEDLSLTVYNLRRELSCMRQNLDSYKALADKLEESKMDLANELKVAGTKEGSPFPLFPFFGS